MLGSRPSPKKHLGAPLQSRKAMLETLCRHLDMVRLSAGTILIIALMGCTGLIDGGSDGLTPQQRNAQAKWKTSAFPVLRDSCVACHAGSRPMVTFLAGDSEAEIHNTVMTYQPAVVNTETPGSSRLLTKGLHDGPEFTVEQLSTVLQWIQAEKDAQASDPTTTPPTLVVPAVAVQICTAGVPDDPSGTCPTNHIALEVLANVGPMIPGAEISFTAHALDTGLFLTNLKLTGGTMGANIEHPLFVSRPAEGDPVPDKLDRYFDLKMNEKPGASDPIGGGVAEFEGFLGTSMLEVHFKVIKAFQPDTPPPTSNTCKALATFKPVAAQLQASCASCHTNGGNGQGALDMTGVGAADDPTLLIACNQARNRIDLVTPALSALERAPDPASGTTHPFKFAAGAFTTFKTSVDAWIQAEKTAP